MCISVIEIKAFLNSKELNNAFKNMESAKNLEKKAYFKENSSITHINKLYGKEWEDWPLNYYISAYNSIDLVKLAETEHKKHIDKNLPEHAKIDTICVLDKGVICNRRNDKKIDALPQPESNLHVVQTSRSLLLFYALTSIYFNQANIPNFNFNSYLGELKF